MRSLISLGTYSGCPLCYEMPRSSLKGEVNKNGATYKNFEDIMVRQQTAQLKTSPADIDGVYAWRALREAGFVMTSPHCHAYFELFYVESGACSFFIDNNMYDLHAGDFLLIPPDVFHYTRYPYGDCRRCNIFFRACDVDESVARTMPGQAEFFKEIRIFQLPEGYREQMEELFARMVTERKIGDERSAPMLKALLQMMFLLCGRECTFLESLPEDIHTTDREIVRAAQFIGSRYMDDISAEDIAAAAGYSPNYLSRKFREAAGISVHEYLVFIRLQHAALELVSTADSVTDIALRCGFSNGNYFKDAFKKKYGVTPTKYRK